MMKIILQEDVPNLGVVGDLVSVRDGYGRNFLIPTGKAVHASQRSIRELDHQKRLAAHRRVKATAAAQGHKKVIEGMSVVMTAKVAPPQLNDAGEPIQELLQKLFGSITNRDVTRVLEQSDINVDHRRVTLREPIRTVGKYFARVRLDGNVIAELPFWVIPEGVADVEAEKKRVEAAQETLRKQAAEAAAAAHREAAAAAAAAAEPKAEAAEEETQEDAED